MLIKLIKKLSHTFFLLYWPIMKEALLRAFQRKFMKTFKTLVFSFTLLNLIKKGILPCFIGHYFEFTCLSPRCSMKRAIDHKN